MPVTIASLSKADRPVIAVPQVKVIDSHFRAGSKVDKDSMIEQLVEKG